MPPASSTACDYTAFHDARRTNLTHTGTDHSAACRVPAFEAPCIAGVLLWGIAFALPAATPDPSVLVRDAIASARITPAPAAEALARKPDGAHLLAETPVAPGGDTIGRRRRYALPGGAGELLDAPVPAAPDPGGVAVAQVDTGVNYLLPESASRLARDADGAALGYDWWDMDRRPFDTDPSPPRSSPPGTVRYAHRQPAPAGGTVHGLLRRDLRRDVTGDQRPDSGT